MQILLLHCKCKGLDVNSQQGQGELYFPETSPSPRVSTQSKMAQIHAAWAIQRLVRLCCSFIIHQPPQFAELLQLPPSRSMQAQMLII